MKRKHPQLQPQQTIGKLTLVQSSKQGKRIFWECQCICGNIVKRREDHLQKPYQHSCNIGVCNTACKKEKQGRWTGYQEISGGYFSDIRKKARDGNKPFTITIEYIWDLFLQQNRKCFYTQRELMFSTFQNSRIYNIKQTASLDRIDPNQGYEPGNVQWVHKDVNLMKNDFTHDEFLTFMRLVAKNLDLEAKSPAYAPPRSPLQSPGTQGTNHLTPLSSY